MPKSTSSLSSRSSYAHINSDSHISPNLHTKSQSPYQLQPKANLTSVSILTLSKPISSLCPRQPQFVFARLAPRTGSVTKKYSSLPREELSLLCVIIYPIFYLKNKKKTGNCEENRSFVECGVILAIFVFEFFE